MKKQVIAVMLSMMMAVGSVGGSSVFAAETEAIAAEMTAQEASKIEQEEAEEELEEVPEENEDADNGASAEDNAEEESAQMAEEEPFLEEDEEPEDDSKIAEEQEESAANDVTAEMPPEEVEDDLVDISEISTDISEIEEPVVIEEEIVTTEERKATTEAVASGTCGENVTWTLDGEGTLTISGTGIMKLQSPGMGITVNKQGSIKKAMIADGVTNVGSGAFKDCRNLKSVSIPDSVTCIEGMAFLNCMSLEDVKIPDNVTRIEGRAFSGCEILSNVVIPKSVTFIGEYAFCNCRRAFTEITIPEGVTSIGESAFQGCTSLTSVTIPDAVTSIKKGTFFSCSSLENVNLGNGVTEIGSYAFYHCDSLTSIAIPESVTSIKSGAFSMCNSISKIYITSLRSWLSMDNLGGAQADLYVDGELLKNAVVPDDITYIRPYAFYGCRSLLNVTISNNVTSIGEYAFCNCDSLVNLSIPNSVETIDILAFSLCDNLKRVKIPDSVTNMGIDSVGNNIFKNSYKVAVYTQSEYVREYCKSNSIRCFPHVEEVYPDSDSENIDVTIPFKIEFSNSIKGNGGYAYLMSGSTIIDSIRLDDEYVNGHTETFRDLTLDFKNIEIGKSCYITIDEGALSLCDDSSQDTESEKSVSYPGLDKNVWTFSTVNLDYASFTNPNLKKSNDEIAKELFERVFVDPTIAGKLYKKKANRLPGGICFGMSYVAAAKKKGYSVANGYGKLRSYSTGNYKDKTSGQSYSLSEYMKMAQIYQLMSSLDYEANEKTKDKYEDIVKKIKANEQVVISIWKEGFNEHRHAILPITITKETDEKIEVLVYDCNGYYIPHINAQTYLNTIVFFKTEGKIDGFEYNDSSKVTYTHMGINTVDKQFELLITGYDYAENIKAQYKEHPLVQSRNQLNSTDLIELTYAAGDEEEDEEDYLYWAESPSYEDVLESDNTISITNGPDEIEITANAGASVRLDIANNTSKIDNSSASSKDYTITHTHAEDYDNAQSIVINGVTSSTINTENTDNGIIVSNENNTPVEAVITITENGEEVASADITATTDSVNVVYNDDDGLTVLEDKDSDGTYETIINTPDEKSIENAEIAGISSKQYTGFPVTQSITVKADGVQLKDGTDYKVEYSNNTNVGTASVIITGIGTYTGKIEKTFKITPKPVTPTITLSPTSFTFNGKAQKPTVMVKDGNKELTTSDYTVTWPSGCTDVGTYRVSVTLKGNYSGSGTADFKITEKEITPGKTTRGDMFNLANNVKVTWKEVPGAKFYKVYREGITDKKESREEPVIVTERLIGWDKQPGLTNGHAYRYKIVASLTGKGDSSGDSPLSYSKVMYRLKTVVIRSVKNTARGKVTVKYDKTTSGDSYVLQYCEREDMVGAKTKVVLGADNTSYTIGGLKKGKTYYISIRVRKKVNGIDYYTTFGVPKKIKVVK